MPGIKKPTGNATILKVEYFFEGHKGNPEGGTVTATNMVDDEDCYYFLLDDLVVADARQTISVKVYLSDGTTQEWEESVEAYVARNKSSSPVFLAFMRFADSAKAYLHGRNE